MAFERTIHKRFTAENGEVLLPMDFRGVPFQSADVLPEFNSSADSGIIPMGAAIHADPRWI